VRARARVRAARPLPRAAETRLAESLQGAVRPAQCRRTRGPARRERIAPGVEAFATRRRLCGALLRSVVRANRRRGVERAAINRLQADAGHGRAARALGLRHLRRALAGPADRAGYVTF